MASSATSPSTPRLRDVLEALASDYVPDTSGFDAGPWTELLNTNFDLATALTLVDIKGLVKEARGDETTVPAITGVLRRVHTLWRKRVVEEAEKAMKPLKLQFASGQWFVLRRAAGVDTSAAAASVARALEVDCMALLVDGDGDFSELANLINWDVHVYNWREHLERIRTVSGFTEPATSGTLFTVEDSTVKLKSGHTPATSPSVTASNGSGQSVEDAVRELLASAVSMVGFPAGDSAAVLQWEVTLAVEAFKQRNATAQEAGLWTDAAVIAHVSEYVIGERHSGPDTSIIRVSPKPQGALPVKLKDTVTSERLEEAWKTFTFRSQSDALAAYKYFQHRGFNVTLGTGSA